MKKIAVLSFCIILISSLNAQETPTPKKKIDLAGRSNDHFIIQLGYAGWSGAPDSINTKGFSKSFNVYFMFDFPFKTNPKLSMAFGPGIGSDHIKFDKTYVGIKENTTTLQFRDQSDTTHFKKTKLATVYLEAPIEFRYTADPLRSGKSLKVAVGVKVGTMLNAHTRNVLLRNGSGQNINDYTMKEASKRYFNTTRLAATARFGLGNFSLFGSYQITSLLKDGAGPVIRPYSIGLTISGL